MGSVEMTDPTTKQPSELAKRIAEAVRFECDGGNEWSYRFDLEAIISTSGLADLEDRLEAAEDTAERYMANLKEALRERNEARGRLEKIADFTEGARFMRGEDTGHIYALATEGGKDG
jgi:hypothetical protein